MKTIIALFVAQNSETKNIVILYTILISVT